MSYFTAWPSWLSNKFPSWLEDIGFPAPGVGDLTDLRFSLGVGDSGKWIGFVNTGWYYFENKEQYHYILKGEIQVSAAAGTGSASESLSFRPSWGPVLLHGVADDGDEVDDGPYVEHANGFYPGVSLTWAPFASGIYSATLPTSSMLVGMRDLTTLSLGSVAGSGDLISEKFYWYDYLSNTVYYKPKSTQINAWVDILYLHPKLKFREIVIQEDDGVLPSYKAIDDVSIIRGHQIETLANSATGLSGYLTHSLSGIENGDWVTLEYYIRKSYVLYDHQTVHYYTTAQSGDVFNINYETSVPDIVPNISLSQGYTGVLNLNPIFSDSHRAGYLFHGTLTNPASTYWIVDDVVAKLDKTEYCGAIGEYVMFTGLAVDKSGLPVPWHPISLTHDTAEIISITPSPSSMVDGRGEIHVIFKPASGISTFTCTMTASAITASASALNISYASLIPEQRFRDGQVIVVATQERTSKRYLTSYVNATTLDGIPRPATSIVVLGELASLFDYNNNLFTRQVSFVGNQSIGNLSAIQQFGYLPQPHDRLVGYSGYGQSPLIEVSE
jgi:hypothetical protein